MTSPKIGKILEHRPTGDLFEVKMVTRDWVILFSRDGPSQIMTGMGSFDYFFCESSPGQLIRKQMGLRTSRGLIAVANMTLFIRPDNSRHPFE